MKIFFIDRKRKFEFLGFKRIIETDAKVVSLNLFSSSFFVNYKLKTNNFKSYEVNSWRIAYKEQGIQ